MPRYFSTSSLPFVSANVETHLGADVSEEGGDDDDTCGGVNYVKSYTIST